MCVSVHVHAHYALEADSKGSAHQVEYWSDRQSNSWGWVHPDEQKQE